MPDEWLSALRSGHRLFGIVHQTRAPLIKFIIGYLVPLVLGLFYYVLARPVLGSFAISASITVIGLMAGFLMNLMLSTGKSETLDHVDYNTSRLVIDRLRYLLWSLTVTFVSYIATLAVGIALLAQSVEEDGPVPMLVKFLTAFFVSGLFLTFIRSIFLPLQIVELHQFQFDKILRSKEKQEAAEIEERRKEAHKALKE